MTLFFITCVAVMTFVNVRRTRISWEGLYTGSRALIDRFHSEETDDVFNSSNYLILRGPRMGVRVNAYIS